MLDIILYVSDIILDSKLFSLELVVVFAAGRLQLEPSKSSVRAQIQTICLFFEWPVLEVDTRQIT
ncbi:hypothetical protein SAMN05443661_101163 [Natronobacterium gregoryi]|uniref:Uncharacterized protein n=2 Tax=Natronobacterium gregoryi TaxID=44930 RepID=L0AMI9_NATGS|nr:hypothetical protein Natgr_3144 [Natronobacterium gregoryi SP2]ELY63734.1 hypothetical protein C490_15829 [Natronobacterium gregoryi SP2]PLK21943.1 hypothetical protein CYV19_00640 [Natronobacterium gregoryi SP2]SFI52808.1 hypothetical protein SAMN05443661_101163 [Natronobacterium gregoryi]